MSLSIDIACKRFRDRGGRAHVAIGGLHLHLAPGEFVCLVGPSGCGKSTLLNLISGLDADFEGRIAQEQVDQPGALGYVFQEPRLMPWLSVLDNVLLVAPQVQDGAARTAQRARAEALLREMELGEVLEAWPGSLSGGMQRRVALARGFMNRPALLLMDEPFVSLDAPTARRLREMLLALWQESGATVVFVTHDVREALALGDRVCFLSPAPARVVFEHRIEEPRATRGIASMLQTLLDARPALLNGLAGEVARMADAAETAQ